MRVGYLREEDEGDVEERHDHGVVIEAEDEGARDRLRPRFAGHHLRERSRAGERNDR